MGRKKGDFDLAMCLIGLGIVLGGIGLPWLQTKQTFASKAIEGTATLATITYNRMRSLSDGSSSKHRYGTFEFTAKDGVKYSFRKPLDRSMNPLSFFFRIRRGDAVPILYNPSNPQQATLNRWSDLWLMPLLILTLSAMSLVMGVLFLVSPATGQSVYDFVSQHVKVKMK